MTDPKMTKMWCGFKNIGILRKPIVYYCISGIIAMIVIIFVVIQRYRYIEDFGTYERDSVNTSKKCITLTLPNGMLKGRTALSSRYKEFYAFQDIPYAKPPIGELRFEDPEPVENWDGVWDATRNTRTCLQYMNSFQSAEWERYQTEDCLYLNVYTPVCPSSGASLSVMVYIYGSGYMSGSSGYDIYGPNHLMDDEIIVVTINYRVGPLGFISTGDTVLPGNYGMKDQVFALKWVRDNIRHFGGDPEKVTIVGHSSGASAVGLHLMSKLSRGLYRSAICMSGSPLNPWSHQIYHRKIAFQLAEYLDGRFNQNSTSEELKRFLLGVPAKEINAAVRKFPESLQTHMFVQGFVFTPSIEPDHDNAFITENMYSAISKGRMDRVPLLIGIVSEEAFKSDRGPPSESFKKWAMDAKELDGDPANLVLDNMHIRNQDEKKIVGETIHDLYHKGSFVDNLGKTVKFFSDTVFNRAIIRHAELQSNFSDVYFYRFSYFPTSKSSKPDIEGTYKVGHGDDTMFLFLLNSRNIYKDASKMNILTSERYRKLITNFMKFSNPTPIKTTLFNNKIWPKVRPNDFQFLDINETITVRNDIMTETYLKWVEIYEKMAIKPLVTF